jgi:hypothetical protein
MTTRFSPVLFGLALLLAAACGGSTSPTSPSRQQLAIATTSLPVADVGIAYGASLEASGGIPPLTWSIVKGALPAGLELTTTGVIAGFPGQSGNSTFDVQVTDMSRPPQSASRTLALPVAAATRPPVNISGRWTGTFTSTSVPLVPTEVQSRTTIPSLDPTTAPIELALEQDGNNVTGTFTGGKITAAGVSGNRFNGVLVWTGYYSSSCPNTGTFSGTVETDHLVWKGSFLPKSGSDPFCSLFLPHDVTIDARKR